ncbi:hypothetical protein LM601614_40789 [Listeria monocytogenes]|nr:hypothetical protein LM601614_40789 [Listeria monocytogenes]
MLREGGINNKKIDHVHVLKMSQTFVIAHMKNFQIEYFV